MTNKLAFSRILAGSVLLICALTGCSTATTQGAGQGAAQGALAGAAAGLVSALVFGGDAGNAMARGAVFAGTAGAVSGGIQGSKQGQRERAAAEQARQAEIDRFRREVGDDAFNGIVALAECKHDVALAYARTALKSSNKDFALAGLWLESLANADAGRQDAARMLFPELVKLDRDAENDQQVQELLDQTLIKLSDIRAEYGQPRTCA